MGESHTKGLSLKIVSETELQAKRSKISGLGARTRGRELQRFFFLEVGDEVGWMDKWVGPCGTHKASWRTLGGGRALLPCEQQVHPPGLFSVPKILKYSRKNHVKILLHSEHFYFWAIFYCTDNLENMMQNGRISAPSRCRAMLPCEQQGHLPGLFSVPKILKYYEKVMLKFYCILSTFIFGSFFYCTDNSENRKIIAFLLY